MYSRRLTNVILLKSITILSAYVFAAVKFHFPVSIFEFLKNVISPPVLGCLLVHGGS